ncbi:uncharacterized protein At4g02000-like [Vicia villosa]|uniref:uncharacterized protein At4g02000-like n=1 Tax=Vicia villosa TaxID=3911 RepID=UPI00273C3969|nr:uncharacterized protein At4g02000-like [Vicia villosa]
MEEGSNSETARKKDRGDKNAALAEGPWFIYDNYLTVKEWSPDIHLESAIIKEVAVWIRISGLPIEYYDSKVLHVIGDLVGRTIKVDKNTLQRERGKYARIYIEVNVSQPLLTMFSIKGSMYKIEYEGLHMLCLSCGRFGHYRYGCPEKRIELVKVNNQVTLEGKDGQAMPMVEAGRNNKQDGPWQVVQKQRRGKKILDTKKKQIPHNAGSGKFGSRFSALNGEEGETSGTKKDSNYGHANFVEKNNDVMIGKKNNDEQG